MVKCASFLTITSNFSVNIVFSFSFKLLGNISINILILLGIYVASKMMEVTIQPIVVTTICGIVIFLLTFIIFSKKDIKNT